jgi:hypothetical protein
VTEFEETEMGRKTRKSIKRMKRKIKMKEEEVDG